MREASEVNIISQRRVDQIGIGLSLACAIHCALTPFVLILLPALSALALNPWFHRGLSVVLPAIALAAFVPGYLRHRSLGIVVLATVGLCFIFFAAFDPWQIFSPLSEALVTTVGSGFLISAHFKNHRRLHCHC